MDNDPDYVRALENLPEDRRKAMLYGDWNVFEGQYFGEFRNDIHVIDQFKIPSHWKRYISMDYGLDMLAVLWYARDTEGNAYVYKEIHEPNLIISEAAKKIKQINNGDKYEYIYAPRDLWNRRQETGKSVADIFYENGLQLTRTSVERVDGWLATKEWLKVVDTRDLETGEPVKTSRLKIFRNCNNLIKNLPQVQIDEKNPSDVATEPHEPTHICDALRYFCVNFTYSSVNPPLEKIFNFNFEKPKPNPVGRGDRQNVI
jgi:phage terminase large subunit